MPRLQLGPAILGSETRNEGSAIRFGPRRVDVDVLRYRMPVLLLLLALCVVGVLSACGGSGGGY
jgi:hypothetical protein